MKQATSKWLPAILTGIMIGTSYIPFPPWALFFCALPLWFSWLGDVSLRRIFISGWVAQFILTLIGFHWIAHTTVEFGQMPWFVGVSILFLFCATANLFLPLAGVIWKSLFPVQTQKTGVGLIGLALTTGLMQIAMPQLFPWNMGYTWFWANMPAAQTAEWVGFEGLSLITWLVNGGFLFALVSATPRSRARRFAGTLVVLIVFHLAGKYILANLPEPDQTVKVSVIQANIGNFEKIMAEGHEDFRAPIIQKHFELTLKERRAEPDSKLVIWPETAFPSNLEKTHLKGFYQSQLLGFIQAQEVSFFVGGYRDIEGGSYFNSIFGINPKGEILFDYDKSILLAFGEYFPFSDLFPKLLEFFPAVSDFGRGPGPAVRAMPSVDNLKIGPQVCYEGLYPGFTAAQARQGAQVIINVTNDSWFGHTFESYQHLYMTLARAVEVRTPMIRSTNTGISAVVTARGDVIMQSPQQVEWTGTVNVPYFSSAQPTLYARFGESLTRGIASLALIVLFIMAYVCKRRLE